MQRSTMDAFTADVNVYMRRHKSALFRTQFSVNYRLFSHGDVSNRFNGKNDNIVLESVDNANHTCINIQREQVTS